MTFTLQILHASDLEGGLEAIENAPNFAAVVDALEADAAASGIASVLLSAGDNYIPGPFFNAGGDFGLSSLYEGFYNQQFNLIDPTVLDPAADTNGDGFFDNSEIEAQIAGGIVTFDQVYTTDVNGDGFKDYFEEIDTASGRLDIAIMNALGFDASAIGNHEFDAGTDVFENIINYDSEEGNSLSTGRYGNINFLQEVDTPGAQFPYLSANLDFSGDFDIGPLFTGDILPNTDFASDLLSARDDAADPTIVGSDSNDSKIAQATVIEAGGEQIGVVGATTQLLASISSPGAVDDVSNPGVNDMAALAATLQPVIDDLIDGADNILGTADDINKVVLVSHLQQFALEQELASNLRGVDVIIAGGSDTRSADSQDRLRPGDTADQPYPSIVNDLDGNPTAIVSTDGEYSYVGRLVVEFDDNGVLLPGSIDENVSGAFATDEQGVLDVTGAATLADALAASEKAANVQNLTEAVTGVVTALDGDIAGEVGVFLNGSRESVRTQETNFGNLTADANLAAAQAIDGEVLISLKNGGGIRASIGELTDNGDGTTTLLPPAANPVSGKEAGEVSELDIDNALRFDNGLVTVELTPEELKIILEHGVAATADGATPGQFPQVGGLRFSFDPDDTAQVLNPDGSVQTAGERIKNVVLIDENGTATQQIIKDGQVADGAPASIKVVTLNFLAGGGDGYPFASFSGATDLNIGEQKALSDYLTDNFPKDGPDAFDAADTPIGEDTRIQNLSERADTVNVPIASGELAFSVYAEFTGEGGEGASEVVAHEDGKLFVTNGELGRIDIFTLPQTDAPAEFIDLTTLDGFDGVQSVAVKNGVVAVAISREAVETSIFGQEIEQSQPGFVALFDAQTGGLLSRVDVGNLPDQLTFSADGSQLLVAGEGEKNDDSDHDDNPLGTVAIIDTNDPQNPAANILDFTAFNGLEDLARDAGIRVQEGVSIGEDLEPEYISISPDGTTAFVSLQENNAIAKIDLSSGSVIDIFSLGTVDFSSDSALDPNDDGVIGIRNFDNLVGFRMADAIASFEVNGTTYIATANEGDSRGFDEDRVGDLVADGRIDPSVDTTGLERLEVSTTDGDTDGDGDIDVLHTFSSRSFSIFDADGNLVFDSGPEFEQIIANLAPDRFNDDDGDTDGDEDRSDAKGPEPEAIAVGEVDGSMFAFIGLERDSGIMIYDITDPANSSFVNYIPPRFEDTTPDGEVARHAPEVITFIPAEDSNTGNAQIAVAYEVSGTTIVYDLTPAVPTVTIPEIQGAGHISGYDGQEVRTTGIVTAIDGGGFYLQDPDGDGDDATSDAIFVFTGFGDKPVAVGDEIDIRGLVSEFIPGGAGTGNLSTTQISNAQIEVVSSGNALPEATVIGAAGRTPPTETVISDGELPVNLQTSPGEFNPETDGIDFYESLEGMRVTVDNPVAISATNGFGESWVVADDGAGVTSPSGGLNDRGGLNLNADADGYGDVNPERIQIQYDNDLLPDGFAAPGITLGDDLSDITGVVDYAFGNYEIRVTEDFTVDTPSANTAEVTGIQAAEDRLTVATYNILNVTAAPADGDAAQIAQLADQIANNLGAPDILALQEVQDDSGVADDGTLSADQTLQAIVDAIEAAGGPRYEFVSAVVDEDGEGGGVPGGNIRNAFLYNPERVDAKEFTTLESDVLATMGVSNPDAFDGSRDPLLGVFEFNGQEVTLINNHLSSRFGSTPIFGGPQPFVQAGEAEREAQAKALNEVVDGLLAADPDAKISVLGDLNTFEFTDELAEDLPGTGAEKMLTNLIGELPGDEAYTFVFQGNSQVLDHIFVTDGLLGDAEVDIVHLNNDFVNFASDHEPVVASFFIEEEPDQFLIGTRRDDLLEGAGGDDTMLGLSGDDTLNGADGQDKLLGFRGDDEINAGDGDDSVVAGSGDDMIFGGDGNDIIRAGAGDDIVIGGEGNDTMLGGQGVDEFIFDGTFGDDLIRGFNADEDVLTFLNLDAADLQAVNVSDGTLITASGDATEGSILLKGVFDYDPGLAFV
ncbi:choice-of-anchor I family protein [Roseovarius sp. CAU 1744]|uniref:choice-of-anchor I family protein n=1 Tax=Roseovarius sp. CAU 1744 TaxID=3140368 RepID=UPI00325B2BE3